MRKKVLLLVALVLALVFSISTQQTFAEENDYVYPTIETNCDRINATAYRFQPGDTLNLTFTVQGPVIVCYAENYTSYEEIPYPQNYNWTAWPQSAGLWEFQFIDGEENTESYTFTSAGATGRGVTLSRWKIGIPEEGEHTLKIVYLFRVDGDVEGFYEINFLSERRATLEEWPPPPHPTQLLLTGGVIGAAIAFTISAVIWHRRKSAKKEEKKGGEGRRNCAKNES